MKLRKRSERSVTGVGAGVGDDCAIAVWRFAAMISEMLKVRDGRIRRILARSSILSVTRNVARGEAGLSNCGANGRAFQGCVESMRRADCHFRYHPKASEDFLIFP